MSGRLTFLDLCLQGKVDPGEIDDFIDRWHEAPEGRELHEFLGMSEKEYARWLRQPNALASIIKGHQRAAPLVRSRRTAG